MRLQLNTSEKHIHEPPFFEFTFAGINIRWLDPKRNGQLKGVYRSTGTNICIVLAGTVP